VVATVTDYAIWAVPVQRYGTSCAGLLVWRGRPGYRPPRNRVVHALALRDAFEGMTQAAPASVFAARQVRVT